jgi:hypothetical protein
MSFFDWLILILAGDATMVVWFKSSLFQTPRAMVETVNDMPETECSRFAKIAAEILSCPLCLPIHIAFWYTLLYYFLPNWLAVMQILAAGGVMIRLSNYVWPMNRSNGAYQNE